MTAAVPSVGETTLGLGLVSTAIETYLTELPDAVGVGAETGLPAWICLCF